MKGFENSLGSEKLNIVSESMTFTIEVSIVSFRRLSICSISALSSLCFSIFFFKKNMNLNNSIQACKVSKDSGGEFSEYNKLIKLR
ncbi:hypothetical protein [Borreliella andersonii]|uniref:hypothetical protein n=1 Tax=Borrelia andersonii TaxID=42109 RepID=UPI003AB3562F